MNATRIASASLTLVLILAATSLIFLPASAGPTSHEIQLKDSSFKGTGVANKKLTINVGDKVHFHNMDSFCHTISRGSTTSASDCSAASGKRNESDFDVSLDHNDEFELNFSTKGTVKIYCRPHATAGMVIDITVKDPADKPAEKPSPGFESVGVLAAILGALVVIGARRRWNEP